MRVGQLSDKGLVRPNNEDSIYSSIKKDLLIIADGMGGHKAGEIASKAAINKAKYFIKNKGKGYKNTKQDILRLLCDAIQYANTSIKSIAKKDESLKGMGTTIIIVIINDGIAYIGHVGDSRAYLISNKAIKQITADHSLAEELYRSGTISKEEALNYPHRNIITRALGCDDNIDVDKYVVKLRKNDILLLCTDGLSNMVSDEEIFRIAKDNTNTSNIAKQLVKAANSSGGLDNISVIVAQNDI